MWWNWPVSPEPGSWWWSTVCQHRSNVISLTRPPGAGFPLVFLLPTVWFCRLPFPPSTDPSILALWGLAKVLLLICSTAWLGNAEKASHGSPGGSRVTWGQSLGISGNREARLLGGKQPEKHQNEHTAPGDHHQLFFFLLHYCSHTSSLYDRTLYERHGNWELESQPHFCSTLAIWLEARYS